MIILPLPTARIGVSLLATSPDQLMHVRSNDDLHKISVETNNESMHTGVRFLEVADSVETKLSPPKGEGVFATRIIPKGTFVCRYVGELLTNDEQEERYPFDEDWPEYCLRLSSDLCIDGANSCHWSRYINHHEDPNLVVRISGLEKPKIDSENEPFAYFQSLRTIDVGEELSFDYGPVYFHVRGIVPAPGTESRTVKEFNANISNENEKQEEVWKKLDLPEIPTTVEEIKMIINATTMKKDREDIITVSSMQKKAAFVRALDYFGAIEWIDDDLFSVHMKGTPDGDATTTIKVNYPSVGEGKLAEYLEHVISNISSKK